MKIRRTIKKECQNNIDFSSVEFGKVFSDHMLSVHFRRGFWQDAEILPYQNIELAPTVVALHYGQSIFEGMKAVRCDEEKVAIFRIDRHFKRFNMSAERTCLEQIPRDIFVEGIKQLVALDKNWIPPKQNKNSYLYIRPFMFASENYIGLRPSKEFQFMILTGPCPAYFSRPVKVKIETKYTRAAKGGMGFTKVAGNYAGSFYPALLAQKQGFDQVLWTDAKNHEYIEESGATNIMFYLDKQLITPPLSDTILNGVTRDSILTLARERGISVQERPVSVKEIIAAIRDKRLQESFGTGTAAKIIRIASIGYEGKIYHLPQIKEMESIAQQISEELNAVMHGQRPDKYDWLTFV